MMVHEFLERLEKVTRQRSGWIARCPAHEDASPSLSVDVGSEGQILVRCFANCTAEAVVAGLGLKMSDLYPGRDERSRVQPAMSVAPVAAWLRSQRRLPDAEIGHIWASEGKKGCSAVFLYRDADGAALYEKHRALDRKVFWRRPAGVASVLYGLAELAQEPSYHRVIVVEGELDFHALSALAIGPVVSVPDGCGSSLTPELLAPLAPFREVIIAVDADAPGDAFALKLARELMPERCRRARFVVGGGVGGADGKDANDALRAGWSRAAIEAVLEAAVPIEILEGGAEHEPPSSTAAGRRVERSSRRSGSPVDAGDEPTASEEDNRRARARSANDNGDAGTNDAEEEATDPNVRRYLVQDGRMCYLRTDRKGNDVVDFLANFEARVDQEITYDDGVETRREFRITGKLASGEALPMARVAAADFGGLGWVTRDWGIRAVVSAGTGTKDHLRTAIQHLSAPTSRRIYRHTGWLDHEGRKVFLYQGGAIGAEGIEVDLPKPLDRFVLPPHPEDVAEAVGWSLRLLRCGPPEVMIPLLAGVYVAPLSTALNPDTSLWLHGRSGSLKSTVSALCQAHFGDFDRKTLSGSWTSTDNSLEHRLFILADVLSVIDDYAPQADPRTQKELDRRVQRILRNVGNRASRGRLGADLNHRPERPPRGFLLCNGEDLPPGHSILARLVPVEVERHRLRLDEITAVQKHLVRLRHAMAGYIEWLGPQITEHPNRFVEQRDGLRAELQAPGLHLRQPEAVATLLLGLDLLLTFAEQHKAVQPSMALEIRMQAREVLAGIVRAQSALLEQSDPTNDFLRTLCALLAQRKVCLLDHRCDGPAPEIEMLGWRKGEMALVIPEAAHRRVAMFARDTGGFWNPSRGALQKDLLARGIIKPANDGRSTQVWRVGIDGKPQRGWAIDLGLLQSFADEPLPPASPNSAVSYQS